MGSSCSSSDSWSPALDASESETKPTTQPERFVTFDTKHTDAAEMANTENGLSPKTEVKAPLKKRTFSESRMDRLERQHPEMKTILGDFKIVTDKLPSMHEEGYFCDVITYLQDKILNHFIENTEQGQRELIGNYLGRINFVTVMANYYQFLLDEMELEAITQTDIVLLESADDEDSEDEEDDDDKRIVILIRTVLWNFSDSSPKFGEEIANSKIFYFLVKDLQKMSKQISSIKNDDFAFMSAVNIIGNCARSDIPLSCFTVDMGNGVHVEIVECLLLFLQKSKVEFVKLQTLLVLAHIVNEDQFHHLTADDNLIIFLLDMIDTALKEEDRRHVGFSVEELLSGLSGMARNDDVIKRIIELDRAFALFKEVILDGNETEQTKACHLLHKMAFEEQSKEKIISDKKLWKKLNKLRDSNNEDLSDAAKLAYFTINSFKKEDKGERRPTDITAGDHADEEKKHIMISYCQKNKETVHKIYDHLVSDNFKVWIDKNDIRGGSLLDAMSKAVEDASVILICYSEEYVSSENCRLEAEYAKRLQKEKIFIRLKYKYNPKGWLGIMLGSQIYHDFSDVKAFMDKYKNFLLDLQALLRKLGEKGTKKEQSHSKSIEKDQTENKMKEEKQQLAKPKNSKDVILYKWRQSDMGEWLKENNLEMFSGLKNLTGAQLTFLYKTFRRAPEFFYKCLEEKLGLRSLEELMRFTDAVERLRQEYPDIDTLLTL